MPNNGIQSILQQQFLNNTVGAYAWALIIFVGILTALYFFRMLILTKLKKLAQKTASDFDDFLIKLISEIGMPVYLFIALYIATRPLYISESIDRIITFVFVVVLTFRGIKLLQACLAYGVEKIYLGSEAQMEDQAGAKKTRSITLVLSGVLWAGGVVFILDNLGIKISAVVAGLGIGGIAVALAAQAVLGDLFSSFAIFLDKPFMVGDFIIVGDLLGVVEHVGIKTTRIRSLHGEQLIFSNSDLTNSRIRNYKRMETRRVAFRIGVTYQTTLEQLKKIPPIVTETVKEIKEAKLDRVHFYSFGDFSLIFEIVYYVLGSDYNLYMDIQQKINFALKERFEEAGIEFAYPTQTLFLTKEQ